MTDVIVPPAPAEALSDRLPSFSADGYTAETWREAAWRGPQTSGRRRPAEP